MVSYSSTFTYNGPESKSFGRHMLEVNEEVGSGVEAVQEEPEHDQEQLEPEIELLPPTNGSKTPCVDPAVKQFPSPILDKSVRQHGGVLLHVFVAVYMFIGKVKIN